MKQSEVSNPDFLQLHATSAILQYIGWIKFHWAQQDIYYFLKLWIMPKMWEKQTTQAICLFSPYCFLSFLLHSLNLYSCVSSFCWRGNLALLIISKLTPRLLSWRLRDLSFSLPTAYGQHCTLQECFIEVSIYIHLGFVNKEVNKNYLNCLSQSLIFLIHMLHYFSHLLTATNKAYFYLHLFNSLNLQRWKTRWISDTEYVQQGMNSSPPYCCFVHRTKLLREE